MFNFNLAYLKFYLATLFSQNNLVIHIKILRIVCNKDLSCGPPIGRSAEPLTGPTAILSFLALLFSML